MGNIEPGRKSSSTVKIVARSRLPVMFIGVSLILAGCVTEPQGADSVQGAPPPSVEVYFYPTKGQTPAQQERALNSRLT